MSKLLVIDDGLIDLFIIDKLLNSKGLFPERTMVFDAEGAMDFLDKNKKEEDKLPDVILLDWIMPEFSGLEFLERYNSFYNGLKKNIQLFVITCSVSKRDRVAAEGYPFVSAVLIKPLNMDTLTSIYLASAFPQLGSFLEPALENEITS